MVSTPENEHVVEVLIGPKCDKPCQDCDALIWDDDYQAWVLYDKS